MTETIDETTVGDLDGVRVGMASMTTMAYALPDGTERTGLVCALVLPDQPGQFVGLGAHFVVEGRTWEVIAIEKTKGELGSVTLRRLGE